MKKIHISMIAAMAACAVFAAADDVLVTFSTPGPDVYADGTTVLDGEFYALCWSTNFPDFKINSDGTADGGSIVLAAPIAKGGRCPTIVYEVDAALAASKYKGGEWGVYLLDTREFTRDGEGNVVASLSGSANKVNTSGQVGTAAAGAGSLAGLSGAVALSGDIAADQEEAVAANLQITGIRVLDGNVYVSVRGVAPYLAYGLTGGDTPGKIDTPRGATKTGVEVEKDSDEMILVAPEKEGGEFFKVERK